MAKQPREDGTSTGGPRQRSTRDPVLWVVGVDEGGREVVNTERREFSTWWAQVARFFDELEPDVSVVNVPTGHGVTVVALLVSSDRVPLVVTNPAGGPPEKEVPWRAGTAIRSAKRSEILRILVPALRLPAVEIREVVVGVHPGPADGRQPAEHQVSLTAEIYLEPSSSSTGRGWCGSSRPSMGPTQPRSSLEATCVRGSRSASSGPMLRWRSKPLWCLLDRTSTAMRSGT